MQRRARAQLGLTLVLALGVAAPATADEVLVDGIAAQVGGDIVLYSEVMEMVGPMETRMREMGASRQEIAKVHAEALERMIEWRIVERIVREAELFATEAEVDETVSAIAQQNGLSAAELRRSVESQGLTYRDYRAQIKREIERRKVLNALIRPQVRVEEDAVEDLYRRRYGDQPAGGVEVRLRQILITYGGDTGRDRDVACSLVAKGVDRVKAGEPFENVASDLSEIDPMNGGDLGWLMENTLASWMRELIEPLQPGEVSQAAVLPFACTQLKLEARREYTPVSFEMAKAELTEEVFRQLMADQYTEWMEQQRSNTFIERRGYFAEAAKLGQSGLFEGSKSGEVSPGS